MAAARSSLPGRKYLQTSPCRPAAGSARDYVEAGGRLRPSRQQKMPLCRMFSAGATGLELATSGVTGLFHRYDDWRRWSRNRAIMGLLGLSAIRFRKVDGSRFWTFADRLLPAIACTTRTRTTTRTAPTKRGDHSHREVRCLSKPRGRALGLLDSKCQTRAFEPPGRAPRTTAYVPGAVSCGSSSRSRPHATTGVDYDCAGHEASTSAETHSPRWRSRRRRSPRPPPSISSSRSPARGGGIRSSRCPG